MAQLVFVHGVKGPRTSNAHDPEFQAHLKALGTRDRLFREQAFGGANVFIRNALWSVHAAQPAWNLACVPHAVLRREDGAQALGGLADMLGEGGRSLDASSSDLVAAAKLDLPALIGGLSALAITDAEAAGGAQVAKAERDWAAIADFVETDAGRNALLDAPNDLVFAQILAAAAEPHQPDGAALGIGDAISGLANGIGKVGAKLAEGMTNLVNSPAVFAARDKFTPDLAIFIGDVFVYLKTGQPRTAIRNAILTELSAAARDANAAGEKLIVAGHSMGGVILYDLLSDPSVIELLSTSLGFPFKVDLLLTIGSQVALFEEMKVFTSSSSQYSSKSRQKCPPPIGGELWWNVYNRLDVLSFLAEPVFDKVIDFEASTSAGITDAHGAYFTNMLFYKRINARMRKAGLIA